MADDRVRLAPGGTGGSRDDSSARVPTACVPPAGRPDGQEPRGRRALGARAGPGSAPLSLPMHAPQSGSQAGWEWVIQGRSLQLLELEGAGPVHSAGPSHIHTKLSATTPGLRPVERKARAKVLLTPPSAPGVVNLSTFLLSPTPSVTCLVHAELSPQTQKPGSGLRSAWLWAGHSAKPTFLRGEWGQGSQLLLHSEMWPGDLPLSRHPRQQLQATRQVPG